MVYLLHATGRFQINIRHKDIICPGMLASDISEGIYLKPETLQNEAPEHNMMPLRG